MMTVLMLGITRKDVFVTESIIPWGKGYTAEEMKMKPLERFKARESIPHTWPMS